jgi:ABC-type glycerol-3-phosphate transport system permease component
VIIAFVVLQGAFGTYLLLRPTPSEFVVFSFIWTWNEFYTPVLLATSRADRPVYPARSALHRHRRVGCRLAGASAPTPVLFFILFSSVPVPDDRRPEPIDQCRESDRRARLGAKTS